MGHLTVMDDSEAQFALTAFALRLWDELAPELPRDAEYDRCGTIWVAADDDELQHMRSKAAFYAARGVAAEILDARALAAAEPHLRPGLAGGLLVPGDRVLYPPNATRFLISRACAHGAELREGVPVRALLPRRVELEAERIDADHVVNAAGAEASLLTPGLPIEPRKGHLVITDRYPGLCRHQLVELGYLKSAHGHARASVAFNLQPRTTGQLLIGSSREFAGWDHSVDPRTRARMIARACAYVPALAGLQALRTWTGFRPATPDSLPLVGEWEPGLWIAAGHEGLGITTSLATGQLIAELILGRAPTLDAAPFAPRRFAVQGHA
jgi:glycine/D-amino acid oxidase-like deaminating enzyme